MVEPAGASKNAKQELAAAVARQWSVGHRAYEYRTGRFLLARKRFHVAWRTFSLVELPVKEGLPLPTGAPDSGRDGWLVLAHPLPGDLAPLTWLPGMIRYVPRRFERYFIDLQMSQEAYLAGLSSSSRSSVRRHARKFSKASGGTIDCREYRSPEEMTEFYGIARAIAARTYQEHMGASLPDEEKWVEHMCNRAANGMVRAYLLFLKGRPVAYLYCPFEHGVLKYTYMGYDPRDSSLSPGSVLLWLALERWFADSSCWYFDFAGQERAGTEQKRRLATGHLVCGNVWFLRRSLKNTLTVVILSSFDRAYLAATVLLERWGVLSRLKKLLRST